MPVTPHEQEVLDAITSNLHKRGLMQELPFPDSDQDLDVWERDGFGWPKESEQKP